MHPISHLFRASYYHLYLIGRTQEEGEERSKLGGKEGGRDDFPLTLVLFAWIHV